MSSNKRKSEIIDLTFDDENDYQIPVKTKKVKVVEEKRASKFLSRPSQKTQDRINRALSQRLYLINQKDNSTAYALSKEFAVLGSTGNVYNVTIAKYPSCTCPDSANCCKHILFVFLKVLKVSSNSQLIYQNALLQSELSSIFEITNHNHNHKDVLAKEAVLKAYNKSLGIETETGESKPIPVLPVLEPGSECPICFEEMKNNNEKLECCKTCCNFIHFDCMNHWKKSALPATCPLCRQLWDDSSSNKHYDDDEGYLNLGSIQGQRRYRDTSTYNENWDRWH